MQNPWVQVWGGWVLEGPSPGGALHADPHTALTLLGQLPCSWGHGRDLEAKQVLASLCLLLFLFFCNNILVIPLPPVSPA